MVDFERGDTCRRRSAERACRRRPWSVQPHWAALGTRGARRVSAGQQYSRTPYNRTAVQPYSRTAVQPSRTTVRRTAVQPYSRTAVQPYAVQPSRTTVRRTAVQPYSRTTVQPHSPQPRRAPTSPARRLHRGPGSERASGGPPTQRESKVGAKLVGSFRQDSPVEYGSSFALGTR